MTLYTMRTEDSKKISPKGVRSKVLWSLSPEVDPGLLVGLIELDDEPVAGISESDDVEVEKPES
jgi:hypothetical protein